MEQTGMPAAASLTMNKPVYCRLLQHHCILFSGEDSRVFLNNLLTCDLGGLTSANSTYGGFCTPKGRILATFLLWQTEQGFFMQLPAVLREPVQKRLSMYILRSKAKASDASAAHARLGVAGEGCKVLLERMFGAVPAGVHEVQHLRDATLIKLPVNRYEIVVAAQKAEAFLSVLGEQAVEAGPPYWDWLDIHAGIPVILPATQEEFVPQMLNLDQIGGVSFTKGCYPGQEIVARMHHLGRLKQRMYLAHIASDAVPKPGDKLYSPDLGEQASGMIVSAAPAPAGGHDVLAVIHISSAAAGNVHWRGLGCPQLKFLPMPYKF